MEEVAKFALDLAKQIQQDAPAIYLPPSEGSKPKSEMVLRHSHVNKTRGYIEKVVYQINGSYEHGWYDACAVMIRRLVETLIIETFEYHKISDKIKNPSTGEFYYLKDLISLTISEKSWNLGRTTKKYLPQMKNIGDQSAHSRRYIAHRSDIDEVIPLLRIIVQELIFLSQLK